MKVLVVDDSAYARHRLGAVLRAAGHEVVEAQDGAEALRLEEETAPAAATVDLLMPGMDGLEVIRRLRARRPELIIVAVSADVQEASQAAVREAGADRFVSKTAPAEALTAALAAAPRDPASSLLTPARKDAFTELMNIAMGQAANALSVLLSRRVRLKVPEVELMTAAGLMDFFREEVELVGVSIRQRFSGPFNGSATMVFSAGHAAFLVRTLVGIQEELGRLSSAEQSVLTEMGNIVLNAAIAVLADHAHGRLRVSLPDVALNLKGEEAAQELLGGAADAEKAFVLVSRLTIGEAELISYLILLMGETDVKMLLTKIG
ncbi:MAG: response regulator [Syntrophobacterales bacterium]|nr:response regulator [Syntrophobacterales bacterium]